MTARRLPRGFFLGLRRFRPIGNRVRLSKKAEYALKAVVAMGRQRPGEIHADSGAIGGRAHSGETCLRAILLTLGRAMSCSKRGVGEFCGWPRRRATFQSGLWS